MFIPLFRFRQAEHALSQDVALNLARTFVDARDPYVAVETFDLLATHVTGPSENLYGRIDDRLVWLCWRYGEQSIDHYHELDAGFAGRKPLAPVRARMLN